MLYSLEIIVFIQISLSRDGQWLRFRLLFLFCRISKEVIDHIKNAEAKEQFVMDLKW